MIFRELVDLFIAAKRGGNRAVATLDNYRRHLDAYMAFCAEHNYAGADLFATETIEDFFFWRSHSVSEATVHGGYRVLRTMFLWAIKRGHVNENPISLIDAPMVTETMPTRITYNEVMQLLLSIEGDDWLAVRDRLIIQILFFCGPRGGELIGLRIDDVNIADRLFLFRRSKVKIEELIPFPRSIQEDLIRWIYEVHPQPESGALWVARNRRAGQTGYKPLEFEGLRQMLRRRCKAARLPRYNPHSFRHGCAVRIIESGGDVMLVKRVLGHRQLSTSALYLKFDTSGLQTLYDRVFS